VSKTYQKKTATTTSEAVAPPLEVATVALTEIAESAREGLLALAVATGLQVMGAWMNADVEALCGPRGAHNPDRAGYRHSVAAGSVTLGGRRVPVTRPRVRAADGSGELPIPSYELFSGTELLGEMAMGRMLANLSTRRYRVGLEPVGTAVEATAKATSKSAVSRKFVAATETALTELMAADLAGLDLVALMIDGVHFGEHCCVVALGIDIDGVKHPLALEEGSTENATLVTDLLTGLRDRGARRLRPPGDRSLPTAQDPQRARPATRTAALHGDQADARRLPRRLRAGRRGPADQAGRRAGQDPPGCGQQPPRGPGRDADRAAPGPATHPRPDVPLDKCHRVDDRHLS
jgi:putative transposase